MESSKKEFYTYFPIELGANSNQQGEFYCAQSLRQFLLFKVSIAPRNHALSDVVIGALQLLHLCL